MNIVKMSNEIAGLLRSQYPEWKHSDVKIDPYSAKPISRLEINFPPLRSPAPNEVNRLGAAVGKYLKANNYQIIGGTNDVSKRRYSFNFHTR
jgi:hypothetical protein